MLTVQEYLKSKTLDQLHEELAIEVNRHDSLPLVILNYNQIESPKTNPIVRECRGLVLNTDDYSIVARSFPRFFNWGEVADEMPLFDWTKAESTEKVDGSLLLFYHFNGEWFVNTRGSFANGSMFNQWQAQYHKLPEGFTWKQGILRALSVEKLSELNLDPSLTYVGEFCSLWNKVVREYKEPRVYLLTCFAGEEEVGPRPSPFVSVERYPLCSADDVIAYVSDHPEATFEGCVVHDGKYRWKIKNPRYLALHHMKGNENIWHPKYMLPFILAGEQDEVLTYFPEATAMYLEYKGKVDRAFAQLETLWEATKAIENQKEFALSIVGKTPFTGVLFNARKLKTSLKEEWRKNDAGILKTLF